MHLRRHYAESILHAYPDTERLARELVTVDGQLIPIAVYTCKVRCSCGRIWIQDVPLIQLDYEPNE